MKSWLGVLLLLFGCTTPASEVLVQLELAAPEGTFATAELWVAVFDEDGDTVGDYPFRVSAEAARGRLIPVYSPSGRSSSFEVYAEITESGRRLARGQVFAVITTEATRTITLSLDSSCDPGCPGTESCVDGRCESACIKVDGKPGPCAASIRARAESCGECGFPVGAGCRSHEDGRACGCAGDACVAGACRLESRATQLASGARHGCIVQRYSCRREADPNICSPCGLTPCADWSSRVVCFGDPADGRLGGPASPAVFPGPRTQNQFFGYLPNGLAPGGAHSCSVGFDEVLRCAGSNSAGQVGEFPVPVMGEVRGWVTAAAGLEHTCGAFVPSIGPSARPGDPLDIYCFGSDAGEALGNGGRGDEAVPTTPIFSTVFDPQVHMDAYRQLTCAVFASELWCWGSGGSALGEASTLDVPTRMGLSGVAQVSVGSNLVCVRTQQGEVLCRGVNVDGELGRGSSASSSPRFKPIAEEGPFLDVAVGRRHACALTIDGDIYCWGQNRRGELGRTDLASQRSPVRVDLDGLASSGVWQDVSAGQAFSCARDDAGRVFCWGDSDTLGLPGPPSRLCLPPVSE